MIDMKKIHYILSSLLLALLVVSCSRDVEMEGNQGYLALSINSLISTYAPSETRSALPTDYDAKTLHVEILDESGVVVKSTNNFAEDEEFQGNILLTYGTYTIVAHSANWDGEGSAFDAPFYYGRTTVVVKPNTLVKATLTCTLANVKVTVNYDQSFVRSFKSAVTTISSALADVMPLGFVMNETTQSGYIPVGDFDVKLEVVNKNDENYSMSRSFTDVKARDHYILNFKLADEGHLGDGTGGGIQVEVDESTNTYTFTFEVPRKSAIALVTRAANAWSNFAYLNAAITAKTEAFQYSGLMMEWRQKNSVEWNEIANETFSIDDKDNIIVTLKGLTPNTAYEYRLRYVNGDTEIVCDPVPFTTESQTALYNGGFEYWYMNGNAWYATEAGVSFWDSSNPGSTSLGSSYNVTTSTENPVRSGQYAAKLES